MSEIHGQAGGTGTPTFQISTDTTPDSGRTKEASKKKLARANVQQDVQESANMQTAGSAKAKHAQRITSNSRQPTTLTPRQLTEADSSNPNPTEPLQPNDGLGPPTGPKGTGNPFFKPNPMTTFFTMFLNMMQAMKQLERVTMKLTLIQMSAIKDTGLAQAQATLEAGKTQANADYNQAIATGVQAGLSAIMLVKSVHTDVKLAAASDESFKSEVKAAKIADNSADNLEESGIKPNARTAAKAQYLNELENKNPDVPTIKIQHGEDLEKLGLPEGSKTEVEAKLKSAAQLNKTADENLATERATYAKMDDKNTVEDIKAQKSKVKAAMQKKQVAQQDEEFYQFKLDKYDTVANMKDLAPMKQELRKEIAEEEGNLFSANSKVADLRKNADDRWQSSESYDTSGTNLKSWNMRAQTKNNDPWFQGFKDAKDILNSVLETLKLVFKGQGEVQTATLQSYGQIMATYNAMIKTGLDSTINTNRDMYQQANELASSLIKMSDQQAQSIHWQA